jgi:hypothetical protein
MEMGGMFTVVKIRKDLAPNDYRDPGWYRHPHGTVAYEWTGATPVATAQGPTASRSTTASERVLHARKPSGHGGH